MKTYSQTYLYKKYTEYDKNLYKFIMSANRIDVNSPEFEDIIFDLKRQNINDFIIKILKSENTVIGINVGKSLPKALKTFVAKDVKEDKNKKKVFIDVTDCIVYKNGKYTTNHIEWIVSYLINAATSYIYTLDEKRLINNSSIINDGCSAFIKCFSYVIDRIYKISTVQSLRHKIEYAAALYYQVNILGRDFSKNYNSIKVVAMKATNINKTDANVVDIMLEESAFIDINSFVKNVARMFKLSDLSVSIVVDTWMKSFGTGTIFAMEYFPAFAMMMSNTFVGGYIDQQLTIEKIAGQDMVPFVKTLLQIGAMAV